MIAKIKHKRTRADLTDSTVLHRDRTSHADHGGPATILITLPRLHRRRAGPRLGLPGHDPAPEPLISSPGPR